MNSPFAYFWNEFIKIPHERVKNGHLGSISPHMVTKIAEMVYTLRNRVRQSGENTPNFVSFLGSSGVRFPFSAQKNKRTGWMKTLGDVIFVISVGSLSYQGSGNFNPSLGLLSPAWCCHARWAMEHSRDAYFLPLPSNLSVMPQIAS
jgi:hypothetical protein